MKVFFERESTWSAVSARFMVVSSRFTENCRWFLTFGIQHLYSIR